MAALTSALVVALLAPAPAAPVDTRTAALPDTFQVVFQDHQGALAPASIVFVRADRLEFNRYGLWTLEAGGSPTAVGQVHRMRMIVNLSRQGARAFQLLGDGASYTIHADRMRPTANNLVAFHTGDTLVALVSTNAFVAIVDRDRLQE